MGNDAPKKFRPERPLILNRDNTNKKTVEEVIDAVDALRLQGWLCRYEEKARPLHLSFNDPREYLEFKEACKSIGLQLSEKVIHQVEEFEEVFAQDDAEVTDQGGTEKESVSYQDDKPRKRK